MCGIVGIVGDKKSGKVCFDALEKLEYRGYDSAGIALQEEGQIKIFKKVGKVEGVKDFAYKSRANIVIAHTRWATNGPASLENCHPHVSNDLSLAIVHNGIIENSKELKEELQSKGFEFYGQTDTEVAVNLIQSKSGTLLERLKGATQSFKGSFAFAVIDKDGNMVVAKQKSPLYVAKTSCGNMVASDTVCFNFCKAKYYALEDGEFATVSHDDIVVYDSDLNIKTVRFSTLNMKDKKQNILPFHHFMEKEIFDIPDVIKTNIKKYKNWKSLKDALCLFDGIDKIKIVGCGTAYHAGLYGAKLLQESLGAECHAYIASEFRYEKNLIDEKTLMIFVSQSGETADTLAAAEKAKKFGCKTLAIINSKENSLKRLCDVSLQINAGREVGVASTKAYVAQIMLFYILARYLKNKKYDFRELKKLPQFVRELLKGNDDLVKDVVCSNKVFFIGRGYDCITAKESALKLKEITYISSEGYPAGELKHGTLALIEENTPVFVFATDKALFKKTLANAEEVVARKGKVIFIAPEDFDIDKKYKCVKLPSGVCTQLLSLLSIIPIQLLSYKASLALGHDPDKPRNLAKSVTVE